MRLVNFAANTAIFAYDWLLRPVLFVLLWPLIVIRIELERKLSRFVSAFDLALLVGIPALIAELVMLGAVVEIWWPGTLYPMLLPVVLHTLVQALALGAYLVAAVAATFFCISGDFRVPTERDYEERALYSSRRTSKKWTEIDQAPI